MRVGSEGLIDSSAGRADAIAWPVVAPTALHFVGAGFGAYRVDFSYARIPAKPTGSPFAHITQHIVKTPTVRLLLPHGVRCASRVGPEPGVVRQQNALWIITEGVASRGA